MESVQVYKLAVYLVIRFLAPSPEEGRNPGYVGLPGNSRTTDYATGRPHDWKENRAC